MLRFKTVILLFAVGLGIGILFAVQFRTPSRIKDPVSSVIDLKDAKAVLDKDQSDLKVQIKQLRDDITQQQDLLKGDRRTSSGLISEAERLRDQAGITEKKDKGLVITLADSQSGEADIDSIVHAADLRDLVNFLWQSNAQAVSINDQRVVTTTSVDSIVNTILINNSKIANPFVIKAIGDNDKISQVLSNDNALKDIKRRQKSNGLIFNVESSKEVTIPALSGGFVFNLAKVKE